MIKVNIIRTKKDKKGLYAIVLFLIFSIVLNLVFYRNLMSQEDVIATEKNVLIEEKNQEISSLQGKVKLLEDDIVSYQPEKKEEISATQLQKQQAYKEVANTFVNAYLNYDSSHLNERREKIMSVTHKDLIDSIAPEVTEEEDDSKLQLSSDPTFTSKVDDVKVYITEVDENLNSSEVIADVSYLSKSTEGKSSSRSLIYLQLKKEKDGTIKVTEYTYYPIK